jgi:hypothetical protein
MNDRTPPTVAELERLLSDYGATFAYPPTPDIAASVEQQLAPNGRLRNVTGRSPLRLRIASPRDEASTSDFDGSLGLLSLPARPARSRQMLELAAGLLVFAVIAAALALAFRGLAPGSSTETGQAPGSLVEDFDLYVLNEESDQVIAIPLDRDTLANRIDLPISEIEADYSYFSGDGSTRVTVDYPPDTNEEIPPEYIPVTTITVRAGLTSDVVASFLPPADIAAPRLSDDGSRLVVSTRIIPGETSSTEWYVLDTATGSVLSSLRINEVSDPRYEFLNSDATRLYRIASPPPGSSAVKPGPLELVSYDLTTGDELVRATFPEIPTGFWQDESEGAESSVTYRSEPGVVISPDDQQLAVINADATLVILLDADTLEIERRIDLSADEGHLDHVLGWLNLLPQDAKAKDLIGPSRHAVFHPDGQHLYSYGSEGVDEGSRATYRGLGLTLVNLEEAEIAAEALPEEDISWVVPAPDGKSIFVGSFGVREGIIWMGSSPFKIRRLDARTLDVLAEREFVGYRRIAIDPTIDVPAVEQDTSEALGPLRVTSTSSGQGLEMLPVDPTTMEPLPGYEPISLGHHYTHAFSPDGRTMAVFVWPVETGGAGWGGKLYLIDLIDWTMADTGVEIEQNTGHLLYSDDGRALHWTLPATFDPAYELYRYDLDTGSQEMVTSFPSSFQPGQMQLYRGGTRLAIWGPMVNFSTNLVENPPHVIIIDLEQDRIAADIEIPNVKAWQHQEIDGGTVSYRIYQPGLAWDLDRELLYIAHADEDRITVVDLVEGVMKVQSDILQPRSLLDRFVDWLVPSAYAKGNPWTTKQAVLSDDGSRLYVAGTHEEFTQTDDGEIVRTDATDLVVVDAERIEEIDRLDLGSIVGMQVAPDDRHLLVRSYESVAYTTGHRLTKLDMATGEVVDQLDLPNLRSEGLTITGSHGVLRVSDGTGDTYHVEEVRIDLESFTIISREMLNSAGYRTFLESR